MIPTLNSDHFSELTGFCHGDGVLCDVGNEFINTFDTSFGHEIVTCGGTQNQDSRDMHVIRHRLSLTILQVTS